MADSRFTSRAIFLGGLIGSPVDPQGVAPALLNEAAQTLTITMAAGAQVDLASLLPVGSVLHGLTAITPTTFTGAPTNINLIVGKTVGGAEYVAATDVKTAGRIVLTVASTAPADLLNFPGPINLRLTAVGGTAPAGSVTVVATVGMPTSTVPNWS